MVTSVQEDAKKKCMLTKSINLVPISQESLIVYSQKLVADILKMKISSTHLTGFILTIELKEMIGST
jgi:hypothetical protein